MTSLFSKAMVYLGLVDEEQVDGEGDGPADRVDQPRGQPRNVRQLPGVEGRRIEPPVVPGRAGSGPGGTQGPPVRPVRSEDVQSDILLVEEFADAKILADRVRDRVPVVLDLRHAQPELVRRVIDFSSGLIYALDGNMTKVGEGLVLVMPPRLELSRDEKRRLRALGVYQIDDGA